MDTNPDLSGLIEWLAMNQALERYYRTRGARARRVCTLHQTEQDGAHEVVCGGGRHGSYVVKGALAERLMRSWPTSRASGGRVACGIARVARLAGGASAQRSVERLSDGQFGSWRARDERHRKILNAASEAMGWRAAEDWLVTPIDPETGRPGGPGHPTPENLAEASEDGLARAMNLLRATAEGALGAATVSTPP
jgi:hypothetical protein